MYVSLVLKEIESTLSSTLVPADHLFFSASTGEDRDAMRPRPMHGIFLCYQPLELHEQRNICQHQQPR